MTLLFVVFTVLMAAVAVGVVLWPLLRRTLTTRPPLALAIGIAFALPLGALALYAWIGTPTAVQASATETIEPDLATAVSQLQARLEETPGDVRGWVLLGRAYQSMQRNIEAAHAYERALSLQPDNAELLVAAAEARSLARPGHQIDAAARAQLLQALEIQPQNQRALWLLGISQYQAAEYKEAIASWQRLLPLIDTRTNATVAAAVQEQIDRAEQAMDSLPASPVKAATDALASTSTPASIAVEVSLDPALRAQVDGDDTVFVLARAVDGPRMPLALARLTVAELPARVHLDDSNAMSPQFTLSMFSQVSVSARISLIGDAIANAGDPESTSATIDVAGEENINLVIDHLHK